MISSGFRIALVFTVLLTATRPARPDELRGSPPDLPGSSPPAPAPGPGGGVAALLTLFDPAVPPGLGARVPLGYSAVWSPARPVSGGTDDLGTVRQDAVARLPLWTDGPDALFGVFGVRHVYTRTTAVLPDSGRQFPAHLWDVRVGGLYRRDLTGGWSAGAAASASSPSDEPYGSPREQAYALAGFVQAPAAAAGDHWLLTLTYDTAGEFQYPLPGLAYLWNPSDRLSASLGLPFVVAWRPTDRVRFDFGYLPVRMSIAASCRATCRGFRVGHDDKRCMSPSPPLRRHPAITRNRRSCVPNPLQQLLCVPESIVRSLDPHVSG